jgi:type I restriction enzyme S subunit
MSAAWPNVALGEVIEHRKEFITIDDLSTYRRPRVQLHAEGIVLRDTVPGAEIKTKKQQVARGGEFLVAEIDAKVGGFGIVPNDLDGSIVSSHYFLYDHRKDRLDNNYLGWFIKTPAFCRQVAAQGSTNYAAIRPDDVLGYRIPLPPLAEQCRIVARIEELARKTQDARILRDHAKEETQRLLTSLLSQFFDYGSSESLPRSWRWFSLADLLDDKRDGMITGPFGTLLSRADVRSEGIPILGIANVQANRFVPGFKDFVDCQKARELAYYELNENDIAIARSGTVGRSCLIPRELVPSPLMSTNLMRLRLDKSKFLPKLLCMLLNGSKLVEHHKESECRGSTRTFFTQNILLRLRIPTPPIAEQQQILSELECLQKRISAIESLQEETAAELDAMLPAILDKAFKGEL